MENVKINDSVKIAIKSMKPYEDLEEDSDKIELLIGNLINVKIAITGMNEIYICYKVTDDGYIIGNNNTKQDSLENNDILERIYCSIQSNKNNICNAKDKILKLLN